MMDSKKDSEEESNENSKNENNSKLEENFKKDSNIQTQENNTFNNDSGTKNSKSNEELQLSSKIKDFFSNDLERKVPILSIFGIVTGLLFILCGVLIFLGSSERVVDNVVFGETGALSVFIIFIGLIIAGFSILSISLSDNPFNKAYSKIKKLELESKDEEPKAKKDEESDSKPQKDNLKTNESGIKLHRDMSKLTSGWNEYSSSVNKLSGSETIKKKLIFGKKFKSLDESNNLKNDHDEDNEESKTNLSSKNEKNLNESDYSGNKKKIRFSDIKL